MKYRLGLDMGATSIGWAVYDTEQQKLVDTGVRIFDDGREDKTKASLCVKRREARSARRLQNRKHIRKKYLLKTLISLGLFPENEVEQQNLKSLNPYELRANALDKQVSLFEIGRICFHLVQRKGFLSGRKDNKEEGGKLKVGYNQLKEKMSVSHARTYGEYLYRILKENKNATVRLKNTFDEAGKFIGADFPFRDLYKEEFNQIFRKQQEYYPNILTHDVQEKLEDILFFQRPLKEAEEGFCIFEPGEKRIPKAHPLFQEFRMWQHVLNLKFAAETDSEYEGLPKEQIQQLIYILENPKGYVRTKQPILTYAKIKELLGLDKKGVFNFERQSGGKEDLKKGILVNTTEHAIGMVPVVESEWKKLSNEQKEQMICVLVRPSQYIDFPKTKQSVEEQDGLIIEYLTSHFRVSQEAATALLYEVNLEDGFAALSEKALRKIVPAMQQGMLYNDACQEAGYHHSMKDYARLDKLPYYGEILQNSCIGQKNNPETPEEKYGKINNATVHVALNQVRQVVNDLIDRYGKPFDISIEYARDLPASAAERVKLSAERDKNEKENQDILKELNDKIERRNWTDQDIKKYKIWKNLGTPKGENSLNCRECPFTGEKISVSDLMNGDRFQIEHLLPYSRSLDDSIHNKVIAAAWANKLKGNKTPYEAFRNNEYPGIVWEEIQRRIKKLPLEQQKRFSKNAMEDFEQKEGPIARSLNDTRYMTRLLQEYLLPIVQEDGKKTVQSVAGKLTAMVRKAWGLNLYKDKENQEDYRSFHNHHAIDAIIVATINRDQINKVVHQLKGVHLSVIDEFKDEFWKLKDKTISKEEKKDLKKRIKNFEQDREIAVIQQYISMPNNLSVSNVLKRVKGIYISHKPKLKNIKDLKSTIGQLHEDTAYGLQEFIDETSLMARFKTGHGSNKKVVEKSITEYIPMFYHKDDKEAYYDAYKNWFIIEGKAKTLNAKTAADRVIKKDWESKEKDSVQELRKAAQKAFKWFVGGGNFCAEIYQINPDNKIGGVPTKDAGEWKSEIISNYNATIRIRRDEEIFYWKNRYPNARRIMTLKCNDMLICTFSKEEVYKPKFYKGIRAYVQEKFERDPNMNEIKILFRVESMAQSGQFSLIPHDVAKKTQTLQSWTPYVSTLQEYHAQKVHVSPTGRILNAK